MRDRRMEAPEMGYDYYDVARSISHQLRTKGKEEWAAALVESIYYGATGTEIFMELRWHLLRMRDSGEELEPPIRKRMDELIEKLDAALR